MLWAVIADDLTGAADTGVQFAKRGYPTFVLLKVEGSLPQEARIVAADTETRHSLPQVAYDRVRSAVASLREAGANLFYKKVDSALRGNLGAEIEAALDASGQSLAVMVPAFPANWRTTVDGRQLIQGVPIEQTAFARDPRHPMSESFIPRLLAMQTGRQVGLVGLDVVRAGVRELVQEMTRLQAEGSSILVVDAVTHGDLRTIAAAVVSPKLSCLAVGSAGLAEALSERLPSNTRLHDEAGGHCPHPNPLPGGEGNEAAISRRGASSLSPWERVRVRAGAERGGVLVISGSAHPQTAGQIDLLVASGRTRVVGIPVDLSVDPPSPTPVAGLEEVIILRLEGETGEVSPGLGHLLAERLASCAVAWLRTWNPSGLVLVGGDTAIAALAALGAHGLIIRQEVQAGVPAGQIVGGDWHGLPVVTKAGAFGNDRALVEAIESLVSDE